MNGISRESETGTNVIIDGTLENSRKYKFVMFDTTELMIYSMLIMITLLLLVNYALGDELNQNG